jgi:hypothetical protein
MLCELLRRSEVRLLEPSLDPSKPLPHSLDYFGLKFSVAAH